MKFYKSYPSYKSNDGNDNLFYMSECYDPNANKSHYTSSHYFY